MTKTGITLEDETEKFRNLRAEDKVIMEEFRKNELIKEKDMKVLNKCRLYLKFFMLSDIMSGDGKSRVQKSWSGSNFKCKTRDTSQLPLWGKPKTSDWGKWRFALKSTFCDNYDRKLTKKLGKWITMPELWEWFLLKEQNTITLV